MPNCAWKAWTARKHWTASQLGPSNKTCLFCHIHYTIIACNLSTASMMLYVAQQPRCWDAPSSGLWAKISNWDIRIVFLCYHCFFAFLNYIMTPMSTNNIRRLLHRNLLFWPSNIFSGLIVNEANGDVYRCVKKWTQVNTLNLAWNCMIHTDRCLTRSNWPAIHYPVDIFICLHIFIYDNLSVGLWTAFLLQSELLSYTHGGCILKISEVETNIQHIRQAANIVPLAIQQIVGLHMLTQKDWHLILFGIWCWRLRLSNKFWPNCSRAWPYYMIFQANSGLYLRCATEIGHRTFSFESCGVFALKKI